MLLWDDSQGFWRILCALPLCIAVSFHLTRLGWFAARFDFALFKVNSARGWNDFEIARCQLQKRGTKFNLVAMNQPIAIDAIQPVAKRITTILLSAELLTPNTPIPPST
jgi:hypothetical protein